MANISLSIISECALNFGTCDYSPSFPKKQLSYLVNFNNEWLYVRHVSVFVYSWSVTHRLFDFSGCSGIKWPMFWSWEHKMEPPGCGRFPVETVKHLKDMDCRQEVDVWCQTVSLIFREWYRVYICKKNYLVKFLEWRNNISFYIMVWFRCLKNNFWCSAISKVCVRMLTGSRFNFITFTCIFYILGKRVCVGYEDGSVKIWDMKTASCLQNVNGL